MNEFDLNLDDVILRDPPKPNDSPNDDDDDEGGGYYPMLIKI